MTIAPCRWASSASAAGSGASTKPDIVKFEGWTRRTARARPSASGVLEVGDASPVRRPDLDEPGAGPADDVRDPDAAADLDELAARDDDPAAAAGKPDREGEGRRVVVGDERVFGAGQRDEVVLGDPGARRRAGRSRGPSRGAGTSPSGARAPRSPPPARAPGRGWCGR